MQVIKKLSSEIIGQIAAGEVVERPASAVKELVENSIDAGAKNVTVELREGGIEYLRVSDNGRGIPAEQIRMAFERHATSKIATAQDLYDIHTLGFRGEALASVAAVAKVTCTTRTETAPFGTRAVVEAGEFTDIRQAASPVGTTIVVENLFHNTPVRLKFLKKPSVEASMVADYMLRLILSRPDIAFRFVSQGKTIYHSMGDGDPESALFCLYGREAFKQMRKVSGHMNGVLLSGYVGAGELSRGNRQQQSFFVNGRYFKSPLLSRALEAGCEGRVMVGRFPMCALFLEVPYQQVDVNVHPNKLEVRFQNEQAVAQAIETLVREAMRAESLGAKLTQTTAHSQPMMPAPKASFSVVELKKPEEQTAFKPQQMAAPIVQTPINARPQTELPAKPVLSAASVQTQPKPSQPAPVVEKPVQSALPKPAIIAPDELTRDERDALARLEPINIQAQPSVRVSMAQSAVPANVARIMQVPSPAQTPEAEPISVETRKSRPEQIVPCSPVKTPERLETVEPAPEQIALPVAHKEELPLRMVGIVFDTYWIFESGDKLLLVDQHAAHERMLYDRLMARFEKERISQALLSPQLVRLTAADMALVTEFAPVLKEAGFEVEPFDNTCVALHAIPTLFGENESPRELLLEALAEWQAGRGQVTRERLRKRVAQMACKHAIKGGDKLDDVQVKGFLREMLKSDAMPTCPHGRPIVTEVTRYALEKRFKRIQ